MKTVGFIGMGNMAGAIASGIVKSGFIEGNLVYAYDIDQTKLDQMKQDYQINPMKSELEIVKTCDVIVMAVKPQVVESVLDKIKNDVGNKPIISIVSGYSYDRYEQLMPGTHHLTIMPNTPAKVLQGMTLFENTNSLTKEEFDFACKMFESIGEVEVIENHYMVGAGALTGCGPAFVYMFIEALADGAVLQGLPRDLAYRLASQMVLGSADMVKETKLHPGVLKDQVCSPGGITIKGVKALERGSFRNSVMDAIIESK